MIHAAEIQTSEYLFTNTSDYRHGAGICQWYIPLVRRSRVNGGLDHFTVNDGEKKVDRDRINKGYSLDGLNIKGDINAVMKQLEMFDNYLRNSRQDEMVNMNLLFFGPPGAGQNAGPQAPFLESSAW